MGDQAERVRAGDGVDAGTAGATELKRGVLPLWAVFGVAIGVLAPASTLALAIGVVAATAGAMSWLTWALTSVVVLGFAGGIAWLAVRFTSTGGLYGLTSHAVGSAGAFPVLSFQLISHVVAGPACVLGGAIYAKAFLVRVGVADEMWILPVCCALITALITFMSYREVKVSAKALLAVELVTVGIIVVLLAVVLFSAPGGIVDDRQFDFSGNHFALSAVLAAAGFAVFSMAGFEHAATLGREARNPRRAIATAVVGSVIFVGVLYVVASYIVVLGFPDLSVLASTAAPLDVLAEANGVGWLGYVVDLGVSVSFIASSLGIMAGTSRTLYTLSRDGLAPRALSTIHATQRTPIVAVAVLGVVYLVVSIAGTLLAEPTTSYGVLGTLVGYLLVAAYGVTTMSALIYAVVRRTLGAGIVVFATLTVLGMAIMYFYSFNPFPRSPYSAVAWIFFLTVAATLAAYLVLRVRRSPALDRIGLNDRTSHDEEGVR